MLAALLKRGCQVNAPTNDGWTALHEAAANGHALIVDKLLASGAQVKLSCHMPVIQCQAMQGNAMPCNNMQLPDLSESCTTCMQLHVKIPAP